MKELEIEQLRKENQELIKNGAGSLKVKSQTSQEASNYVKFLEKRITETTDESKRHLAKYADLRVFAYNQIESLLRKH